MIHPSLCLWHWDSPNLSLCELRLVQIAQKQYDLLEVTWIIFRDGIATLLCTFPYSNPGPNPLTLKPPCAPKLDTKTASNGQREKKNIQAFHSLSNNKKSTNKKQQQQQQQQQLFAQQTKKILQTPEKLLLWTNWYHCSITNQHFPLRTCHGTRCRLRIWTWRHGSSRSSCWKGRRQKNHILDGGGRLLDVVETPRKIATAWNLWKWYKWWFSNRNLLF